MESVSCLNRESAILHDIIPVWKQVTRIASHAIASVHRHAETNIFIGLNLYASPISPLLLPVDALEKRERAPDYHSKQLVD